MSERARNTKRIVFCWELGGGLGHLGPIVPVARALQQRGYDVAVISREVSSAKNIFDSCEVTVYPAPRGRVDKHQRIEAPCNYAHILHNSGWCEQDQLDDLVTSWRELFRRLDPRLVVCDHSPTARLAAHTLQLPAATFGTGFCCPPAASSLPDFRCAAPDASGEGETIEPRLLNRMNHILDAHGVVTFGRFADLLHRDTAHFLTTFRELDHYPQRRLTPYWGAWSLPGGTQPQWPKFDGEYRAVAYIKPFPYLAELLSLLVYQRVSLLVYCPGVSSQTRDRLSVQQRIRFVDQPMDLNDALHECDFAVFNAGHGSTVTSLLAGKPMLQVPLNMEQKITSERICDMGAGEVVETLRPLNYSEAVGRILDLKPHQLAAQSFSSRYRNYDPDVQIELLADDLSAVASRDSHDSSSMSPSHFRAAKPDILLGLSPSEKMLSLTASHFSQFDGATVHRQPLPLLPWDGAKISDEEIETRLAMLEHAYPGVALVGDIGVSYLPHVSRIAEIRASATFLCIFIECNDLIAEVLETLISRYPGRAINHWSEERSGFDDHPLDACYPTYRSRDVVTAVTRFHREFFRKAEQCTSQYPDRFQIVDLAALQHLRHTAVAFRGGSVPVDR